LANYLTNIDVLSDDYVDNIINVLSGYYKKEIQKNGDVSEEWVRTNYFLENNTWNVYEIGKLDFFKDQAKNFPKTVNRNIYFNFHSEIINLELKYYSYKKIFSLQWKVSTLMTRNNRYKLLASFLSEIYPQAQSIFDLNIDEAEIKWLNWLHKNGYKLSTERYQKEADKVYKKKTKNALFFKKIYEEIFKLLDDRIEWEKDVWNVKNLKKFGIDSNPAQSVYLLDFTTIHNKHYRKAAKKYFKTRLLARNQFSWATANTYLKYFKEFMNFINLKEPNWTNFQCLSRNHIEDYLEHLNKKAVRKKAGIISEYIHHYMVHLKIMLDDFQLYDYDIAYKENVNRLIRSTDIPSRNRDNFKTVKHIPDQIIDQLLPKLKELNKTVRAIVWVMFKTGLRISDVLSLKHDCLVMIEDKFVLETDIRKTKTKNHMIPIDDELASMIASIIEKSKEETNKYNNPERYLFCYKSGSRAGKPPTSSWVRDTLNVFARENNICDNKGNIYHFKNHAFRHTYAVRMINHGVDIVTLQSLLDHASPRMTTHYARIVDDTKRKQFDKAVKNGAFSFSQNGNLVENPNPEKAKNILQTLWTKYKLDAVDTPYGLCIKKANGRCDFAQLPPCLTRDGGSPCKDLCVSEKDIPKYKVHIESVKNMIHQAKIHDRKDWKEKNQDLLKIYENIYSTIEKGNIIYGRKEN